MEVRAVISPMISRRTLVLLLLASIPPCGAAADLPTYDPLHPGADPATVETRDLEVIDTARARSIPVLVYRSKGTEKQPVLLFSHGLGGSRKNNPYLGQHWARRGYTVVFLQHPGSDEDVWKKVSPKGRQTALSAAANVRNLLERVRDVPAVLDQLERWNGEEKHWLEGKLDLTRVGMSGHSFGAVTTQAVSGQRTARAETRFTDERIDAALAMSPSVPAHAGAETAFGKVSIPWLLMTGTKDDSPIGNTTAASRLRVFDALPEGDKYELVLKDGTHMAFSEGTLRGGGQRNPNHHRVILGLSTAFWDAYLKEDPRAIEWLSGDAPKALLDEGDLWLRK
jgi:predicted dienelactone hydrolase